MKDPARLLEASANELERRLLQAGASELPPAAAMQRLAAELGVHVGVADPTPNIAPKLPLWAASKGTLIGAGVLGLGVSLWLAVRSSAPTPADSTSHTMQSHMQPEAARVAGSATQPASDSPTNSATQHASDSAALGASDSVARGARDNAALRASDSAVLGMSDSAEHGARDRASDGATRSAAPGDAAARSAPLSSAALPSASGRDARSLKLEIARIDTVRRHLAARRAKHALAALQAYERDFPEGVLSQEAELLAIEAHSQVGDRQRAHELASRFLANHPDSPHRARVREPLDAFRSHAQ